VRRVRPKERPFQRFERLGGSCSAAPIRRPMREGQGSFRGVGMVFEACGAALDDASVGDLRDPLRSARQAASVSVCRSLGVSCALRGLRLSPARGPRGHHRGVASGWRTILRRHSVTVSFSFEASAQLPGPSR